MGAHGVSGSDAARLMELLALSEEELCSVLDSDPLALLSGQFGHRPELPILLDLLEEVSERVGPQALRRWLRLGPSGRRPLDSLLARDFAAFERALEELRERGLVIRGGGSG